MSPRLPEPLVSHLGDDGGVELLCRHLRQPPANDREVKHVGVRSWLTKPEKGKADGCRWDIANSPFELLDVFPFTCAQRVGRLSL